MLESEKLEELLDVLDPLLEEPDRFKQRGAAEILAGLLRGKCQPTFSIFVCCLTSLYQVPSIGPNNCPITCGLGQLHVWIGFLLRLNPTLWSFGKACLV
jgi:hypothetical protein